jgi:signal transduction histidine kinase
MCKLVERAIRSSDKGKKVLVTCTPQNERLIMNVIDEGVAIPVDDCDRIFDKYFQANESTNHGMGLGLYVSRKIAEAHGGSLSVSSQQEAGATFTVNIPMNKKK